MLDEPNARPPTRGGSRPQELDARRRPVAEVMRRQFIWISPGEDLLSTARMMGLARVRHLPVVSGERLEGMVSQSDLLAECLRHAAEGLSPEEQRSRLAQPLGSLVRPVPGWIEGHETLSDAAQKLLETGTPFVPVVHPLPEGLRLIGMVTESDLLRAAYEPVFP